jgi:hypothetical protein
MNTDHIVRALDLRRVAARLGGACILLALVALWPAAPHARAARTSDHAAVTAVSPAAANEFVAASGAAPASAPTSEPTPVSALTPATAPTLAPASASAPAALPALRLGNAAKPFGWSTVVGDFNADGLPDIAVADRTTRRTVGYSYRIEFAVSGQPAHDVTFESDHGAVTLRISDVDHDNDLDVVAEAVISGETVGVWLNDGHGRFTSADIHMFPRTMRALQTVGTAEPLADPSASGLSPRRVAPGLGAVFRHAYAQTPNPLVSTRTTHVPITLLDSAIRPRAPPLARIALPLFS